MDPFSSGKQLSGPGMVPRFKRRMGFRRRRFKQKRFKKFIKRVANMGAEKKYFYVTSGGPQTVDSTGSITSVSDISQGDTDITRDGDQVYLRSIEFVWEADVADTFNQVRFIVVQWYPPTTPVVSDVLIGTGTTTFFMPYNHDKRFNFKILYDRTVTVDTNTPSKLSRKIQVIRGFRRRIQYLGGATDGTNKIYVLKISDSGAASHPLVDNYFKLNFSDM